MKYTKEERLEIGKKIHESGLSDLKMCGQFGICEESARRYRILYEESAGIQHINLGTGEPSNKTNIPLIDIHSPVKTDNDDYASMTKEELIEELMKSKIREERLKKGYMVKGVGSEKKYIPIDSKNIK